MKSFSSTSPDLALGDFSRSHIISESSGQLRLSLKMRQASAGPISIPFQLSGTASSPADFTLSNSSFNFSPGSTEGVVIVYLQSDAITEPDETLILDLQLPPGVRISGSNQITIRIQDDDLVITTPPVVSFSSPSQSVLESAGTISIGLTLSAPSTQTVTVPISVSGTSGTADYGALANSVSFAPGATSASIPVGLVDDALAEGDETLILSLGTPVNATLGAIPGHTLTLQDNDTIPTIQFSSGSSSVSESLSGGSLTVNLSNPTTQTVVVPYTVSGTASAADHGISSGSLSIAPGMQAGAIPLILVNDTLNEADETLIISLGTPQQATLGSPATHVVTIVDNDPMPTVRFGTGATSVQENVGTINLPVSLSAPSGRSISVGTLVSGTATSPADHNLQAATITFSPGQTSASIPVAIVNDGVAEPAETLVVTLTNPVNVGMGIPNVHTVTLTDVTVVLPTVQWTSTSQSVSEGAAVATLTVGVSAPVANQITVPFTLSGSANSGADYTVSTSSLIIPAGSTSASLTVNIANDTLDEADETVVVTLGTPSNATLGATQVQTLTLLDNDNPPTVQWQLASQQVAENVGTLTVLASLSAASGKAISANYSFGGSAILGNHYTAPSSTGTLNFPVGSTSATLSIPIVNNNTYQGPRTLSLTLTGATNAALGPLVTHTTTINDDESAPLLSFASAAQTVSESVGAVSVPLSLSVGSSSSVTVSYTVTGTASAPGDHNLASGSLTFPAGATSASLPINVTDDTIAESSETIVITLGSPLNASLATPIAHTITITDNEVAVPTVQFASSNQNVAESAGAVAVQVSLSSTASGGVTVPYTVSGTASAPSDHNLTSGSILIPAGSSSGAITLSVMDDTLDENNETIILTLGTPNGAILGSTLSHTLTLQDNDNPPVISWSLAGQTVFESAGTATVSASLSNPSGLPVSVPYTVSGTAGNPADHNATNGTLSIPAGQQSASLSFNLVNDSVSEGNETILFSMGTPVSATLGPNSVHTVTVTESSSAPIQLGWATTVQTASEGAAISLMARLNAPAPGPVSAQILLSGIALAGSDYLLSPGSITIPAGALSSSVTLSLANDAVIEPNELATFTLSSPSAGVTLAPGQATYSLTITDSNPLPVVGWKRPNLQFLENAGTVQAELVLSAPSSQNVTVTNVFQFGSGGVTLPAGPLTIPAGTTSVMFPVSIPNNTVPDTNGRSVYQFFLSNPINAILGPNTLLAVESLDDEVTVGRFEAVSVSTSESSGSIVIRATLDRPYPVSTAGSLPVSVHYQQNNTPVPQVGSDFTFSSSAFVFQPGATTASITLNLNNDTLAEPTETVILALGPGSTIRVDPSYEFMNVTIADDDSTGLTVGWALPGFYSTDVNSSPSAYTGLSVVSEASGTQTFLLQLNKPSSAPLTFPITVVSGNAVAGTDYLLNTNSVTIPAGSTSAPFSVSIVNGTSFRGGRNFVLGLGAVSGVTQAGMFRVNVSIRDDEAPPEALLTSPEVLVSEGVGSAVVPVALSALSAVDLTAVMDYTSLSPGVAGNPLSASSDYSPTVFSARQVTFSAGSVSGTLQVPIQEDSLAEDTEYARVNVQSVQSSGVVFVQAESTTTLLKVSDNDPAPQVQWNLASQTVMESAGRAIIAASLASVTQRNIRIPVNVSGTAQQGVDYQLPSTELVIPAGASSGTFEIPLIQDSPGGPDKTLILTLTAAGTAPLGSIAVHTLTIQDPQTVVPTIGAFQTTVYNLVRTNACINCHAAGSSPFASADINEAFNAAVPRVNFGNIPQSLLATKISPAVNHQGQSSLYNAMITQITAWRDGSLANPAPTPPPAGALGSVGIQDAVQFEGGILANIQGLGSTPYFSSSYESTLSSIPSTGLVNDLSPPAVGAYLSIASEYCNLLVYEVAGTAANKRGFNQISGLNNFNITPASFTPALQDAVTTRFADMFWQRTPTAAELTTLQTLVSGLRADNANTTTKDLGAAMCTAIAGAVDGIDI